MCFRLLIGGRSLKEQKCEIYLGKIRDSNWNLILQKGACKFFQNRQLGII